MPENTSLTLKKTNLGTVFTNLGAVFTNLGAVFTNLGAVFSKLGAVVLYFGRFYRTAMIGTLRLSLLAVPRKIQNLNKMPSTGEKSWESRVGVAFFFYLSYLNWGIVYLPL